LGFQNIVDKNGIPKYFVYFDKNLIDIIGLNVSFDGISQNGIFIKFVIMFSIVGSLETILTVKAVDIMDTFKRKSDYNKDLIAVGVGNIITGCLGGLPMISEVARSSANVDNGGKTRWANFFHGVFIAFFLLFALNFSNLIPKPALAAMLIGVGFSLAHPKKISMLFSIGKEQFAVFLMTVIVSLATDLLLGIASGILLKIIFHLYNGVSFSSLFNIPVTIVKSNNNFLITINKAALFTNYLVIKNKLLLVPQGNNIIVCLKNTKLVDHSVMVSLNQFKNDYESDGIGGTVSIIGLENHKPFSNHKFSSRKLIK
jgi:MFS superfamily sulfate permease-like transporter